MMLMRRKRGDGGQALPILLTAMICLLSLGVLMLRLGHAGEMRTRAQTAADAAALGAVANYRKQIAEDLSRGNISFLVQHRGAYSAAKRYATANNAVISEIETNGSKIRDSAPGENDADVPSYPGPVKVKVTSGDCQVVAPETGDPVIKPTPSPRQTRCTEKIQGDEGIGREATGVAIAKIDLPPCEYLEGAVRWDEHGNVTEWARVGITCAGVKVATATGGGGMSVNTAAIQQVFRLSLTGSMMDLTGGMGLIPDGDTNISDPERKRNQELGKELAESEMGWTGAEWECLDELWFHESGWNHRAKNPSSGAYGIPQSLPATKMGTEGADWATNPATQIKWGLKYIKGRPDYGTPCKAWSLWQSRSPHWY
ncbi:MAG: hypothetical protein GEV11_27480 [Streptosporangiales bacterium]|nr:hypothetical protein [Streptosporangiales bacterium]